MSKTKDISKPNIESMKGMMDYEFNYHLDFENWDDKEFVDFLKDLLDGKTEYGLDDKFPKETVKGFIGEHWVPTKKELKEFRVVSTETIRKEVYVMAKNWEHAEEIASGDVDWEILPSEVADINAEEVES